MSKRTRRAIQIGLLTAAFAMGWLGGSLTQPPAEAQVGELMKKAGEMGGPVGSAAQLGSSIVEMQEHVNGLQKNIDTLKQIKAALGG
jgi:hypothetical protein